MKYIEALRIVKFIKHFIAYRVKAGGGAPAPIVTNDRFHKNGWNFTVMIQSPADRLPAQQPYLSLCLLFWEGCSHCLPDFTSVSDSALSLLFPLGLNKLEIPRACLPPSYWLIRLCGRPSQEPSRRGGDWELWIWETFHGVVNNKVRHFDKVVIGKVVQSYSRMKFKSKYGLLPDNILYNDYISCFAVSCSRWLPTAWCRAAASCWTNADKSMN